MNLLDYINPPGYNPPWNLRMLWNQWLHQGFLWGWYSYEFHTKYLLDVT